MSVPTKGEEFAKMLEHIRLAAECAATIAHLTRDEDALHSKGWLGIEQLLQRMVTMVTSLATRGMH